MGQREIVLVVDDERDAADLCRRLLQDTFDVIAATDGNTALKECEGKDVAVAVVDQRMPGMTGLEILTRLQETHPNAGRVVMTAYTDLEVIVELINTGRIAGFVLKPWNNHVFRQTISQEVELHTKRRTIAELDQKLRQEHRDMLDILRELDPSFEVPRSNDELKEMRIRLRNRVVREVEKLFVEKLLSRTEGNVSEAARLANINRTLLHRLLDATEPDGASRVPSRS